MGKIRKNVKKKRQQRRIANIKESIVVESTPQNEVVKLPTPVYDPYKNCKEDEDWIPSIPVSNSDILVGFIWCIAILVLAGSLMYGSARLIQSLF